MTAAGTNARNSGWTQQQSVEAVDLSLSIGGEGSHSSFEFMKASTRPKFVVLDSKDTSQIWPEELKMLGAPYALNRHMKKIQVTEQYIVV